MKTETEIPLTPAELKAQKDIDKFIADRVAPFYREIQTRAMPFNKDWVFLENADKRSIGHLREMDSWLEQSLWEINALGSKPSDEMLQGIIESYMRMQRSDVAYAAARFMEAYAPWSVEDSQTYRKLLDNCHEAIDAAADERDRP